MLSARVLSSINMCHLKIYFGLSAVFILGFLNIAARRVPDPCQLVFTFTDRQAPAPVQTFQTTNPIKSAPPKPWSLAVPISGIWSSFKSVEEAPKPLRAYLEAHGLSSSAEFQRHVLSEKFGMDFGQTSLGEIYVLNNQSFKTRGLDGLFQTYKSSPYTILSVLYPDRNLKPWKFTHSLSGIWSDFESVEEAPKPLRAYLEAHGLSSSAEFQRHVLFETLGIDFSYALLDDIYSLDANSFLSRGLRGMLKAYSGSPFLLLSQLFPSRDLKPWKFTQSLSGIWSDFESVEKAPKVFRTYLQAHGLSNSRDFHRHVLFETFGMDFNQVPLDDIYVLNQDSFTSRGFGALLNMYSCSPYMILSGLYPDRDLKPWKFAVSVQGIWSDFESIEKAPKPLQAYLQARGLNTSGDFKRHVLSETFGIDFDQALLDEIYDLTSDSFKGRGLVGLSNMYINSPYMILSKLYPSRNLKPWKFTMSPVGIWSNFESPEKAPQVLRAYLEAHALNNSRDFHRHILFETFEIDFNQAPLDEIYVLDNQFFECRGLHGLLKFYNSQYLMLSELYPDRDLKPWKFATSLRGIWSDFESVKKAPKPLQAYLQARGLNTSGDFKRHVLSETFGIDFNQAPLDDVYLLTRESFLGRGLSTLLALNSNSPYMMLSELYPDRDLKPWKFTMSLLGIWSEFESAENAPQPLRAYLQTHGLSNSRDFHRHVLFETFGVDFNQAPLDRIYGLNLDAIESGGLSGLVQMYKSSPYMMLSELYPSRSLKPWKSTMAPQGIWSEFDCVENAPLPLRAYLEAHGLSSSAEFQRHVLFEAFGVDFNEAPLNDIYLLSKESFETRGVLGLLKTHNDSPYVILSKLYPDRDLKPWGFLQSPHGIWSDFDSVENAPKPLQAYLEAHGLSSSTEFQHHVLFETLGIDFRDASLDDIYSLDANFFLSRGLRSALKAYSDSRFLLLSQLYPNRDLKPWKFTVSPNGIWSDFQSIEQAPNSLQDYLRTHNLNSSADFHRHILSEAYGMDFNEIILDDIYILNQNSFKDKGLMGLVQRYNSSPYMMLSELYPSRDLKPWKFTRSLQDIWSNFESDEKAPYALRAYLQAHDLMTSTDFKRHVLLNLCREYNVETIADCAKFLSLELLKGEGLQYIKPENQSINEFLCSLFGLDKLELLLKKKTQALVTRAVKDLFHLSEGDIRVDYKSRKLFYTNLKNPQKRGYPIEFDIYIPKLRLAIEVHGLQHSQPINYFGGEEAFASQQARDLQRREAVKLFNETHGNSVVFIEIWHSDTKDKSSIIRNIKTIIERHTGDIEFYVRSLGAPEFTL